MKKIMEYVKKKENIYQIGVFLFVLVFMMCPTVVFANNGLTQVTAKFKLLLDLVSTVVSVLGSIITLWGISEWGLSLQGGNGGMMEAQGFKRIMGGIVMILGTNLLAIFTT